MAIYEVTEPELEMVAELQEARHLASVHAARAAALRDDLVKILSAAEAEQALTADGSPAMHLEVQHRRKVNSKKLEALYPDVYDECAEESEVILLRTDLV